MEKPKKYFISPKLKPWYISLPLSIVLYLIYFSVDLNIDLIPTATLSTTIDVVNGCIGMAGLVFLFIGIFQSIKALCRYIKSAGSASTFKKDDSSWWIRVMKVIYAFAFIAILGFTIYIITTDHLANQGANLFKSNSTVFYINSLSTLIVLIVFEIIRRIFKYMTSGASFLNLDLPIHTRFVLVVIGLILTIGIFTQLTSDIPRHRDIRSKLITLNHDTYTKARENLNSFKESLIACKERQAEAGSYDITVPDTECARKKNIERGLYNDCRQFSSHARCIDTYDYEVFGSCEKSIPNPKYISCSVEYNDLHAVESFIQSYESDRDAILVGGTFPPVGLDVIWSKDKIK